MKVRAHNVSIRDQGASKVSKKCQNCGAVRWKQGEKSTEQTAVGGWGLRRLGDEVLKGSTRAARQLSTPLLSVHSSHKMSIAKSHFSG